MRGLRESCIRNAELMREIREVIERTRNAVNESRALLQRVADVRPPAPSERRSAPAAPESDPARTNPAEVLAETLLKAHRCAAEVDDPVLKELLAQALWHAGQRLAHSTGPRASGVVLH